MPWVERWTKEVESFTPPTGECPDLVAALAERVEGCVTRQREILKRLDALENDLGGWRVSQVEVNVDHHDRIEALENAGD